MADSLITADIIRKQLKNSSKIDGFMENRFFATKWVLYTVLRGLVEKDSFGFVFCETELSIQDLPLLTLTPHNWEFTYPHTVP